MRRHNLDAVSLGFGVIFVSIGLLFLFLRPTPTGVHAAHLWPAPVIAFGALIVTMAIRGSRRGGS